MAEFSGPALVDRALSQLRYAENNLIEAWALSIGTEPEPYSLQLDRFTKRIDDLRCEIHDAAHENERDK